MKTEIELLLREFISENLLFAEDGFSLKSDDSLLGKGIIDSTGIMELVEYVSSRFSLEIPMRDINQENFDSIARLADYIRRRQHEGEQAPAKRVELPMS